MKPRKKKRPKTHIKPKKLGEMMPDYVLAVPLSVKEELNKLLLDKH